MTWSMASLRFSFMTAVHARRVFSGYEPAPASVVRDGSCLGIRWFYPAAGPVPEAAGRVCFVPVPFFAPGVERPEELGAGRVAHFANGPEPPGPPDPLEEPYGPPGICGPPHTTMSCCGLSGDSASRSERKIACSSFISLTMSMLFSEISASLRVRVSRSRRCSRLSSRGRLFLALAARVWAAAISGFLRQRQRCFCVKERHAPQGV